MLLIFGSGNVGSCVVPVKLSGISEVDFEVELCLFSFRRVWNGTRRAVRARAGPADRLPVRQRAFLEQRASFSKVAPNTSCNRQVFEGLKDARLIVQLTKEGQAFLEQGARSGTVVLLGGQRARSIEHPRSHRTAAQLRGPAHLDDLGVVELGQPLDELAVARTGGDERVRARALRAGRCRCP